MKYYVRDQNSGRQRFVGEMGPDKVFVKFVRFSSHFFRNAKAFGIDEETVKKLCSEGCRQVVIYETENQQRWEAPFALFEKRGWNFKFSGYEMQRFLEKKWWIIYNRNGEVAQYSEDKDTAASISARPTMSAQQKLL
jgi:hypothetical protein